ncbi:MAG: hypothetical protein ACO3GK_05160 [Bacteroidia bacterium]
MNWDAFDFIIAAVLIGGLVLGLWAIQKAIPQKNKRLLFFAIALLVFALVWAELAVGVFGSPWAGS